MKAASPQARFYRAFSKGSVFPESHRAEIAFCGRSNVGKSSLLNALTGVRGLARTSKTPGRTREIHFYETGKDRFFVDLPGYGYAKVAREERAAWQSLVEGYLDRPERIALAVLLVDARHPPFESDMMLGEALSSRAIPFVIVLTKVDRARQSEGARAWRTALEAFPEAQGHVATSARTGLGLKDLARVLDEACARAVPRGAATRRDRAHEVGSTPSDPGRENREDREEDWS